MAGEKPMPADLAEILASHPQLEGMKEALPNFPPERRQIPPLEAPRVNERFVELYLYTEDSFGEFQWTNQPKGVMLSLEVGKGQGFGAIPEKPVIREPKRRPNERPDMFDFIGWQVVSQRFVDVLRAFDATAFRVIPIEWRFRNHTAEYFFFEVTRAADMFDYKRSAMDVEFNYGRRLLYDLLPPKSLKPGNDALHIVVDSWRRRQMLVSRELARALVKAGMRGLRFRDLATGQTLDLPHIEHREIDVKFGIKTVSDS